MYLSVYKLGTFSLYKDCWPQAAPRTEYLSQEDRNKCGVCVCVRERLSVAVRACTLLAPW